MSIKELQKDLLASFGEKLTAFGFEKKAKNQSFYRYFEGGWAAVHLSFIQHAEDFDVTISVSIRFDDVEGLVNSSNNILTKKEKKGTSTLGVELGNLSVGEQKRWKISSENQVPLVADSLLETFEVFGEPYLAKYSSIQSAFELLSSDDKNAWKHCPFHAARAKRAIAIAKILEHPDMQKQISTRRQFLEDIKDFGLSDFVRFAKRLSS